MDLELRQIEYNNWILIVLITCICAIAIARWLSSYRISDLLSSFYKYRFIKITRNSEKGASILIITSIAVYTIQSSLLIYLWLERSNSDYKGITSYLIILTLISAFLLAKHFIGKLIAEICNFQEQLELVDHQRNIYRAMLGYVLLILNSIVIYSSQLEFIALKAATIIMVIFLLAYNIILVYTYRKMLFPTIFYFILYLCTLETTPYLLLYKYFKL
ncbi:uncharacterized protein DUF4271 [Nonlabens dokdonensis]|uniref:DUF4271 domain-containing protein n=2 Tax=Nonlabens dokdonensis TaxID=328515 RepID=L7W7Q7_NONDD|nr:hypothetical protein DDD_1062 [Nonlabens dokdonensis DSW-6]PZX43858.1 uncharacterized protein DUF4271 [Nonlabens dokdonensis]